MHKKTAADTTRIDQQIESAKARLKALYSKRRAIIAAAKPPKRMSSDERAQQIFAMALTGASIPAIAAIVQLSKHTVRHYLSGAIYDAAHEELLKEGKATKAPSKWGGTSWTIQNYADLDAKESEIRARCSGVKWRTGNYRTGQMLEQHKCYFYSPPPETTEADWGKTVQSQLTKPTGSDTAKR